MKNKIKKDWRDERGGAGVKLAAVLVVLFLLAHAGFNYIPVAYDGESFKQEMQTAVVQGLALPNGGKPVEATKARILRAAAQSNVPADAFIEVKIVNAIIQAHVAYSRQAEILPLGLYTYNYEFDHTATPTGFLMK
ncbi:MAG: hypothetical protein M3Q78_02495 [Acidobacteriota bacterium]|nr:hypothetical protein [Acidobacteriota bacterium]